MAGRAGCAWRASKRTRLGFSNWISDMSSMRRIRSSSAMNLASAFSRVVFGGWHILSSQRNSALRRERLGRIVSHRAEANGEH